MHWDRRAASRAACTAGRRSAIRTAMMAITTRSSISVNPRTATASRPSTRWSLLAHIRDSPDVSVGRHEADHEVLILARRLAVDDRDADYLVAGPPRAVPRAVLGGEDVV